jgi:hypothetical protein
MDECPVCLEPLSGTVVEMGCCHNKVHIQCYLPKCPMCRASLPFPNSAGPNQVIVPIPVAVPVQPTRCQKFAVIVPLISGVIGVGIITLLVNIPRG